MTENYKAKQPSQGGSSSSNPFMSPAFASPGQQVATPNKFIESMETIRPDYIRKG